MDYDIEWLFDEVYKIKKINTTVIKFVSDWDVSIEDDLTDFKSLISNVYSNANKDTFKYNYAYEQFALKRQIIEFAKDSASLNIEEEQITITPSATTSIYLISKALEQLRIKRILIITPAYFSTHEAFKNTASEIIYYHLKEEENLAVDFLAIERIVIEQYIDAIILTDPVYSAGIEFTLEDYNQFASISIKNDIYLIVDYSLGGLRWDNDGEFIINSDKLSIVKSCNKFVFIDTLTKRLLLNGIKFSILIGDESIIDKVDSISETIYGALNSTQCYLIKELYSIDNKSIINNICNRNIIRFEENYNRTKSFLLGTDFSLERTNSGYFSLINHNELKIKDINTKLFSLSLLKENNILCISKDRFTYFPENKFGFRINLNKNISELSFPISQCIGIDYHRFKQRQ